VTLDIKIIMLKLGKYPEQIGSRLAFTWGIDPEKEINQVTCYRMVIIGHKTLNRTKSPVGTSSLYGRLVTPPQTICSE